MDIDDAELTEAREQVFSTLKEWLEEDREEGREEYNEESS